MNDNTQDMVQLSQRAQKLIGALSEAIMDAAETAAERIQLATAVAKAEQRMAAFSAVLECIDAQRQPLLERLASGSAAERKLCQLRLEMLAQQEQSVLVRAGAPAAVAAEVVQQTLALEHQGDPDTVRVPAHNRRKPERARACSQASELASRNGVPVTNGHGEG